MATKNISITNDAYSRLKRLKQDKESFSDVINRVTKRKRLSEFAGILTEDSARRIQRQIRLLRRGFKKSWRKRSEVIQTLTLKEDGMS